MTNHRWDMLLAVIISLSLGVVSFEIGGALDPRVYGGEVYGVWFTADLPRIVENATERWSDHYRTNAHPLFSLVSYSPVFLLRTVLGLDPFTAVRIFNAVVAACWVAVLFVVLRLNGCRRFDALLFTLLAACSSSAMFWLVVPETYALGSLSILLTVAVVALAQHRQMKPPWYIAASAISLSITVTNWMFGLLATFLHFHWKRATRYSIYAFAIVCLVFGAQKFFMPSAQFFIFNRGELRHTHAPESCRSIQVLSSFFYHSMVMPEIEVKDHYSDPGWKRLLTRHSLPGSGSAWGLPAIALWTVLLGLGLKALWRMDPRSDLRLFLGLGLIGQLVLHLLYGSETFLYSLHFAPLLVLIAALGTRNRGRLLVLLLAAALAVTAVINNKMQLRNAFDVIAAQGTPLHNVAEAMEERPKDPWPRRLTGETQLQESTCLNRYHHTPGGSFSPSSNSFGVSIWIRDQDEQLIATSDDIPLEDIHQRVVWSTLNCDPVTITDTRYYRAEWSALGPRRWQLDLLPNIAEGWTVVIAIRSVGPSAGTISSLQWENQRLLIDSRWTVEFDMTPKEVRLGDEREGDWMKTPSVVDRLESPGWGYSLFVLDRDHAYTIEIEDRIDPNLSGQARLPDHGDSGSPHSDRTGQ